MSPFSPLRRSVRSTRPSEDYSDLRGASISMPWTAGPVLGTRNGDEHESEKNSFFSGRWSRSLAPDRWLYVNFDLLSLPLSYSLSTTRCSQRGRSLFARTQHHAVSAGMPDNPFSLDGTDTPKRRVTHSRAHSRFWGPDRANGNDDDDDQRAQDAQLLAAIDRKRRKSQLIHLDPCSVCLRACVLDDKPFWGGDTTRPHDGG